MPVRPDELRPVQTPLLIAEDRPCRACGYNLKGLKTDGKCPECGKAIARPRDPPRFVDQMVHAPLVWLKGFRRGTCLLCFGGWAMTAGLLAWVLTFQPLFGGGAFLGSILWIFGTILATTPRPRTPATQIDPLKEWRRLRVAARWSQPFWTIGIGSAMLVQATDTANMLTILPLALCAMVSVVGCWPLFIYQSNLAYWASDTDLADKLRNTSWGIGGGLGLGMGVLYVIGRGWCGGLIGNVLFVFAWLGMILFTLGYVVWTLWLLWRMAHWVTLNHITGMLRDERLRERARKARAPVKPL